jgi:hypothetical protein
MGDSEARRTFKAILSMPKMMPLPSRLEDFQTGDVEGTTFPAKRTFDIIAEDSSKRVKVS